MIKHRGPREPRLRHRARNKNPQRRMAETLAEKTKKTKYST